MGRMFAVRAAHLVHDYLPNQSLFLHSSLLFLLKSKIGQREGAARRSAQGSDAPTSGQPPVNFFEEASMGQSDGAKMKWHAFNFGERTGFRRIPR
jgi:hypothetical protein